MTNQRYAILLYSVLVPELDTDGVRSVNIGKTIKNLHKFAQYFTENLEHNQIIYPRNTQNRHSDICRFLGVWWLNFFEKKNGQIFNQINT